MKIKIEIELDTVRDNEEIESLIDLVNSIKAKMAEAEEYE
tara:strand:+ start:632 stop:751 length:120 start_codon:yes stop_codon:yes gene_type:complete